jgi:predicted small secreted protein
MLKRTAVSLWIVVAVVLTAVSLSGCETCKGMGRDVSNVGKMISGD